MDTTCDDRIFIVSWTIPLINIIAQENIFYKFILINMMQFVRKCATFLIFIKKHGLPIKKILSGV